MAVKFPYTNGSGPLIQVLEQLRNNFPQSVTAETLKKLGIASNNESYIINVLNFLGMLDENGNKTDKASKIFSLVDDKEFSNEFGSLVRSSYKELFDLHTDNSWTLDLKKLTAFFRQSDQSSSVIGDRQAKTFQALSSLAGYVQPPSQRKTTKQVSQNSKETKNPKSSKPKVKDAKQPETEGGLKNGRDIGLTVRIEINLPAQGDQETYDRIFKSIRENLINAK